MSHNLHLSSVPRPKVRRALKKPETERSQEEAAVLLLHRETVEELCKRQVRTDVLKRKQEEVSLPAIYEPHAFQFMLLVQGKVRLCLGGG